MQETKIPKIIHYFWLGGGEKSELNNRCIASWKKYCPDFEIIEWNEDNYDFDKNLYMKQALEAKKYGFATDYARLDVLERYGGFYFDTDVEIIKDISSLCQYEGFIGFETDVKINDGQGFGAVAHHPIIQEMMSVYDATVFLKENGEYNLKESPVYRTELFERYGLRKDGSRQKIQGFEVFEKDYFCPKSFDTGIIKISENTFSIHHFEGSWHTKRELLYIHIRQILCRFIGEKRGEIFFVFLMNWKDKVRKYRCKKEKNYR